MAQINCDERAEAGIEGAAPKRRSVSVLQKGVAEISITAGEIARSRPSTVQREGPARSISRSRTLAPRRWSSRRRVRHSGLSSQS